MHIKPPMKCDFENSNEELVLQISEAIGQLQKK
jgi:hypothetical protein